MLVVAALAASVVFSKPYKIGPKTGQIPSLMANWPFSRGSQPFPGESHLSNIRQITFGGENAEAYWNVQCDALTWQAKEPGYTDDQIFAMNGDGTGKHLVSTGTGRCTCSYFTPDSKHIIFSSTYKTEPQGQAPVDMSKGYVWKINPNYRMYIAKPDGSDRKQLLAFPGHYLAETTLDPKGRYMTWTTDKDNDLEVYRSDLKGGHIKRLTKKVGYDGGPFASWDGKWIVYRRDDLNTKQSVQDYRELLAQHLIRPTKLEIWLMDANGGHKHQITHLGCASFAPFLTPDDKKVIFSSNYGDPKGREFDLFMINVDGTGLERITRSPGFDGFPMFTRDGKKLVWCSNRFGTQPYETNVFIADWKN